MPNHPTPTISRVLPDGTIIELIFDADTRSTSFAVSAPGETPLLAERYTLPDGEVLVPYSPTNNLLASGCVLLPSAIGDMGSKAGLLADIKAFIHLYVSLTPEFLDIASHYVLLSWVYDAFNEIPYLRLSGEFGSGKTRTLLVLGSLVYKGFFASGASTVSPIFHVLHEFQGTLIFDEADLRFSDATADLVKILNNGTMKGLPVLRTLTNRYRELNPQAFRVFGPKIVAMRESFRDNALESRFLTENMADCQMRGDIPVHLPDSMKEEALLLRNRLLAWRFASRHAVSIDSTRTIPGLSPRGNQMALPLLSLVDDAELRNAIATWLATAEARAAATRASLPHVAIAGVIDRLFATQQYVTVSAVADVYNRQADANLSARSVGQIIRRDLGLTTMKTRGVYVVPTSERKKVGELAKRCQPNTGQA